ncbi:hypothetical protein [Pyxidicoccus sp. MSG2]|uniref:hypothetical protein n=1 Tax=Pyxidicoccus sp. MSG2 TaxID=2996790 RepID=UPI00226E4B08|nr:hypothetical protein [Pyxidicoccus sp. MSG2]MCY1019355.1 hypothetical protein [Pyxidicoccus sp. MSG2]
MPFLSTLLQDKNLLFALLVMVGLILMAWGFAWRRKATLAKAVQSLDDGLEALLSGVKHEPALSGQGRALWRAIREQLVFPPGHPSAPVPVLIRTSPSQELRETCRALFRHSWGHGLGRNLTGTALVMTFGLLGYVLVGPVQEALRASQATGTASQSDLLSQAIGSMGAKFFVSALGLIGSFIFQALSSGMEAKLLARLDAMRPRFESLTRTLDAHEVLLASARGDALGSLRTELVQTRKSLADKLEKLESVNVSLQDIGTHVQTHLGNMMKEHVGDVLTRQLSAVEQAARDIAEDVKSAIATGLATTLQQEMSTVRESLHSIEKALSGRQEHDLGRILEQLRDTVSGGFHSQSQDMSRQLERLADVFPRLEEQFASLARTLGENARQWGSENQRAVDTLAERVTVLVESFDRVRDDLETAAARVLKNSTESSHRMSEGNQQVLGQLNSAVSAVLDNFKQVLAGMNGSTDALIRAASASAKDLQAHTARQAGALDRQVAALQVAADAGMQDLHARSEMFSKRMEETQAGLIDLTKQLQAAAAGLVTASRGVSETQERTKSTSSQMADVASQLSDAAKALQRQASERQTFIENEVKLLRAQAEALNRVDPVFAGLASAYEESVKKQVQYLSSKWNEVMRDMQSVVTQSSGELAQGVDDLADAVRELKDVMRPQPRRT